MDNSSKVIIALSVLAIGAVSFGVFAVWQSQNAREQVTVLKKQLDSATAKATKQSKDGYRRSQ